MKKQDVLTKLEQGVKLFQSKSFMKSGQTLRSKVTPGDAITYRFEDGTTVHHMTGKALLKSGLVTKGAAEKTLGGWRTEIVLKK